MVAGPNLITARLTTDFTNLPPFMRTKFSMVYVEQQVDLFHTFFFFLTSFDPYVWLGLLVATITFAVFLILADIISPNRSRYDILHSLYVAFGSMLQVGQAS
ncbi:unnamed protein product [Protopolystoma xenopodis]|uniref:Uncharacterized protein n=1 Tax=Protopolystoma xenopodis TaxID=117903 RepID=A0A3S4ZLC1_9PLAT|nr:unnamed protein product [Protopolystoma xenopodis]